ncbi:E3 ubiquitin-protein ligase KCMF1-like [Chironomus tepperi]|uniref:E3 ubiquitin-protein ligase KCMF1-like n=1 Tax=Chironomus tepperi TaxID=113505 RepID=UPI00391F2A88
MSKHDGVSCDYCMKSNFRGRRYKCLICYDYDLCAECYESNATSTRHTTQHAVQCILTRSMIEVSYGSGSGSPRQYQSFTCPYCSKKGFSETTLLEHVTAEHSESDSSIEVICPVCASSPGGDPNLKTDDLAEHLTLEHQRGGTSTFEFINEPSGIRHGGVRRISRTAVGAGVRSARRSNNASFSPSNQEPSSDQSVDLFAELQQTLAGGSRRQLQQLQMQIQMERQAIENRITNIGRRPGSTNLTAANNSTGTSGVGSNSNSASISIQRILSAMSNSGSSRDTFMTISPRSQLSGMPATSSTAVNGQSSATFMPTSGIQLQGLHTQPNVAEVGTIQIPNSSGQFLMPRLLSPAMNEDEREQLERDRADRALYIQELLLGTVDENSQNVITPMPLQSVATIVEPAIQQFQRMTVDDEHNGGAQGTVYHGNEAMKKNFMRKKEMSSVDDGGKKQQKGKVANARK